MANLYHSLWSWWAAQPRILLYGLAFVLVLLVLGAIAAAVMPRLRPGREFAELKARVTSWWVMAALLAAALLSGWQAATILFGVVSFLALKEFLSLAPMRKEDRLVLLAAYLAAVISYVQIARDDYLLFLLFIPVWTFLILPFLMACAGQTRGYLNTAATLNWGLITCVYNLGYAAFLTRVPDAQAGPAQAAGLLFFLLVATEFNDVMQYVTGKLFGRHKIMPRVSPNKTWEGFLGGWAATAILIWFLAPWLTPLSGLGLAITAIALPLAGFAGDVTMSAIKRDLGVKDTSSLIPGHGGVLDRVDSLTFTAPVFFHILAYYALARF